MTRLDLEIDFTGTAPQTSHSALNLHRECPQAWLYRYGMRLEPVTPERSPHLTIGRWWAMLKSVEVIERARVQNVELAFGPKVIREKDEGVLGLDAADVRLLDIFEAAERRWGRMSAEARDEFAELLGESLPERLRGMFELWDAAHADRFEREVPIGVEIFFRRPLPTQALAQPNEDAPTLSLIGFVDYLYYDRERQMTVLVDDKATKDLGRATSLVDDLMDSQLQLYVWGMTPALKERGIEVPRVVAFDRTSSVAPKSPALTATGTLSKSVTAYDVETYRRWAQTDTRPTDEQIAELALASPDPDDPDGTARAASLRAMRDALEPGRFWGELGAYFASGPKKGKPKFGTYTADEKLIEELSTPAERARWTKRSASPVNRRVLETHLRSAVETALSIAATQARAEKYGDAARNFSRFACGRCDFADLCRAQMLGGPSGDYDVESYGLRVKPKREPRQEEAA